MVKMLTVLVSPISNSQVFLLKMCGFCKCKSYSQFFSKNAIFNDQSFNNMLTNNSVSLEQVGPECGILIMVYNVWHTFSSLLNTP